jgi:hypothetical protein
MHTDIGNQEEAPVEETDIDALGYVSRGHIPTGGMRN